MVKIFQCDPSTVWKCAHGHVQQVRFNNRGCRHQVFKEARVNNIWAQQSGGKLWCSESCCTCDDALHTSFLYHDCMSLRCGQQALHHFCLGEPPTVRLGIFIKRWSFSFLKIVASPSGSKHFQVFPCIGNSGTEHETVRNTAMVPPPN